jgi:hypothetical protein
MPSFRRHSGRKILCVLVVLAEFGMLAAQITRSCALLYSAMDKNRTCCGVNSHSCWLSCVRDKLGVFLLLLHLSVAAASFCCCCVFLCPSSLPPVFLMSLRFSVFVQRQLRSYMLLLLCTESSDRRSSVICITDNYQ